MQNKGLIRFLAWAFVLVCLYQLSFTLVTRNVERNAKAEAARYVASDAVKNEALKRAGNNELMAQMLLDSIQVAQEAQYLDSMATEKVYLGQTYRYCQAREINLGLDLKGGMNVMLEVSTVDVVRALANNTTDSNFNRAIEMALAKQKRTTNMDFVSLFYEAIVSIDPNVRLASYFNSQLRDQIKLDADNDEVIKVVSSEAASAYDRTYEILRQRIDKFGVAQPTIQQLRASERILVELPGVKDPERVRKLLQGTAQLEFWGTYECADALRRLELVDNLAASANNSNNVEETTVDTAAEATTDSVSLLDQLAGDGQAERSADDAIEDASKQHPLLSLMELNVDRATGQIGRGPVVGYAPQKNRAAIDRMINVAFDKKVINSREIKFLWSAKPIKGTVDIYQLFAIKIETRDATPLLDGGVITDARQDFSTVGGNEISMTMNTEGAREWKRITGENVGNCIAIVLDNLVYSAPVVHGEIAGYRSSITGDFTLEEAKDLANILKSGKLPAPAVIVQEAVVGPSLGQESIHKGIISFILAFIVVLIYMVVFYNRAGWVSLIALFVNIFLLMGIVASIGSVLTMPGIAGIVLTMAMAVDGNVIIYERIKEELCNGSSLSNAVESGFKNALSAIVDGQVTTFLLGLVLIMFGSGPVQGFAVTLCIGVVTSLFTSIFITRLAIDRMLSKKRKLNFSNAFSENFLRNVHFDFLGKRKLFYTIAVVAIVICIGSLAVRGMSFGIDFTGGRTYVVRFDQPVNAVEVRSNLAKQFEDAPEVKTYGPSNQLKITTKYKVMEDGDEVKNEIMGRLYEGTKDCFANAITLDEFRSTETNPLGVIQAEQVGATIANDLKRSSFLAVLGGLLVIFVYIGLRFRSWRYGVGSVVALAHDTVLVIGVFSLLWGLLPFNLEVDQSFIAAVLTVIGYSINSTVVIFDRVRENRKLFPKRKLMDQMNDAINATLARTFNTNGTTFATLLMMFIFGGEVIRGFIFALLVGVICGVFSSLFLACGLVFDVSAKKNKQLAE